VEKIDDCISFLAAKAAQAIARLMRERLAPHGITPVQYAVLQALWEQDGIRAAELCGRLVIDSATVTGVVDRLENLELIERRADQTDRRVNCLFLTREARRRRASLQAVVDGVNDEAARIMGADAPVLRRLLRRLAALGNGSTF
jgi:MarR family transcriptional regulator, organic hydroperoxide resistance regulator